MSEKHKCDDPLKLKSFISDEINTFVTRDAHTKLFLKIGLRSSELEKQFREIAEHETKRIWDYIKRNGRTGNDVYVLSRDTFGMNKLDHDIQRISHHQGVQPPHIYVGPEHQKSTSEIREK